jgi:defect in organelle trafficking protein DotC
MMAVAAPTSLPTGHYTLNDLENLSGNSAYYATHADFSTIRQQAMQEAAQALGMQAALSYESKQIDQVLEGQAPLLTQIFDFNQVLYQHNVLPPVLDKARDQVNINSTGDTIRIAGVTYRILAPVRFVTAPPIWRDYIWMSYPPPELPSQVLLPQNDDERKFWQANVDMGWSQGINQAVSIYQINLAHLVRDYNGMVLYKELLAQNMVSPYHLDYKQQGITGTGDNMVIDDQTMQVTTQPQLQLQGQLWQAAPISSAAPAPAPATVVPVTPPNNSGA